eukprot:7660666-Ditylum_brightwellii.AAC.1
MPERENWPCLVPQASNSCSSEEPKSPALYDDVRSSLQFAPGWVPIEDDDKVMSRLLLCNKLHLHQALDSPFAHGPLKEYISNYGLGSSAQDILDGNFDPNAANNFPTVNFWLRNQIQRMAPTNSIKVDLTLDDYKELIKSQCEPTSSSPSGQHYGHYRAALTSESISLVHATMMTLPFLLGFTLQRWQTSIDIMLEKDPGSPKIS